MISLKKGNNNGVRIGEIKPTDYIAGAVTGIEFESRVSDGNWSKYKPTDEWQRYQVKKRKGYDTMSCVTFSALNSIEMQIKFLIENDGFTVGQLEEMRKLGYIDDDGNPNFNDWYSSVLSGTTSEGNYLINPWNSFRTYGLLAQKDGYEVNDFNNINDWLGTKPTDEHIKKAKRILDFIDIKYEWVGKSLVDKHIQQAPLHALVPTSTKWTTEPPKIIKDFGANTVNHAVCLINKEDRYNEILDHYDPFVKYLATDYYMPAFIKGVVYVKKEGNGYIFKKNIYYGQRNSDVVELQKRLKDLGFFPEVIPCTGYYGEITRRAVEKYQIQMNVASAWELNIVKGKIVGYKTRRMLNM